MAHMEALNVSRTSLRLGLQGNMLPRAGRANVLEKNNDDVRSPTLRIQHGIWHVASFKAGFDVTVPRR